MRCHRRLHFTRFFQTAFLELRIQFLDFYCFVFRGGVGYFEKYEKYRAFPAFRKVHSAKAVSPLFAFNDAGFHVPFQHPVFVPAVFCAPDIAPAVFHRRICRRQSPLPFADRLHGPFDFGRREASRGKIRGVDRGLSQFGFVRAGKRHFDRLPREDADLRTGRSFL